MMNDDQDEKDRRDDQRRATTSKSRLARIMMMMNDDQDEEERRDDQRSATTSKSRLARIQSPAALASLVMFMMISVSRASTIVAPICELRVHTMRKTEGDMINRCCIKFIFKKHQHTHTERSKIGIALKRDLLSKDAGRVSVLRHGHHLIVTPRVL